jgi:kynurenine 3-monooxygenase
MEEEREAAMDARNGPTGDPLDRATIAIVGGGPAGLVTAAALAARGIRSVVFDRDQPPKVAPRFNPERSYSIDITGHGLRALRHIDATPYFDSRLVQFKGIQMQGRVVDAWPDQGWTGSRGDILRALVDVIDDRHRALVDLRYETLVTGVDVHEGTLNLESPDETTVTGPFDAVVGADGAGSVVRRSMEQQLPGFEVENTSIPNYVTMLELSRVGDSLDEHYLQALSVRHFTVAGAVNGEGDGQTRRWFCCVGSKEQLALSSVAEARAYFEKTAPAVLDLASEEDLAAFVGRATNHVGKAASCSMLHGGRAVLVGDAAAAFPPIGQGVNAAMESAVVLDRCLQQERDDLREGAARYNAEWKPEADAVSWIAQRVKFEEPLNMLRSLVTMALGVNVVGHSKRTDLSYSQVRRNARLLGPVWG